jgi:hypothetical protein
MTKKHLEVAHPDMPITTTRCTRGHATDTMLQIYDDTA